ncbi:hypothetical protein GGTG_11538 [Gaeumannomyces tritici R3-111a-1]|uniref:Uncharacterized protein n=1 Tax=Gaeumannomyces tritici (strain R3-111a-1) TaxID=644352 RepID=J3PDG7_GAET3|nr:hypothetical protein GGTG_11538 [Gaeumannomyces tritici R3-111a-1]EJT70515.1 hypothetical protein GGTG_11538 [Gaeumannomyces tritici R3-111a-1]
MHFCAGKKRFGIGLTFTNRKKHYVWAFNFTGKLAAILLLPTFLLKYFLYLILLLTIFKLGVIFADFLQIGNGNGNGKNNKVTNNFFSVINSFAVKFKKKTMRLVFNLLINLVRVRLRV